MKIATATMAKVDKVVEMVRNVKQINLNDIDEIVRLQDLVNVNAEEAEIVMQGLNVEERRQLLWIITTVSGYNTFNFWLEHGIQKPWAIKRIAEIEKMFIEDLDGEFRKAADKLTAAFDYEAELKKREAELDLRELELRQREVRLACDAERRAGAKVRFIRQQLAWVRVELEEEKRLGRKAKRVARLLEKI